MNKITLIVTAAMLMGSGAHAGETIVPPVTKYVNEAAFYNQKRPDNFGKVDEKKIAEMIAQYSANKK